MRTLVIFGCALAAGCNDPTYIPEGRQMQIGDDADAGMGALQAADTDTFTIPIRPPTGKEADLLGAEQMQKTLMLEVPWVAVRDMPVQVQYTLKNLDDVPAKVFFTATGGNEFGIYDPTLFYDPLDPEAIAPPPLLGGSPINLGPHEQRTLYFREDDIAEAAVDLEAILRYPGMTDLSIPFKVLTGRSDVNPIGTEMIPMNDVTPQILIFTFTLTADAHVTVDYNVRVRNLTDRLAPAGSTDLYR